MSKTVIPFGPQHPVLPEPIHLQLTVEDEIITSAVPALGFVHRGLETLVDRRDFHQMVQVVERVCGICSMIHAMCFCQGIESIMEIEVPLRARYLRAIWSELHRLQTSGVNSSMRSKNAPFAACAPSSALPSASAWTKKPPCGPATPLPASSAVFVQKPARQNAFT
jgi:Ni,Fe-hydrogenase III large subunit